MAVASLSKRLSMLEAKTASNAPKIIFIIGIATEDDPIVGIRATFRDEHYEFTGNDVSAMLSKAELMFESMLGESKCELVFIKHLT